MSIALVDFADLPLLLARLLQTGPDFLGASGFDYSFVDVAGLGMAQCA